MMNMTPDERIQQLESTVRMLEGRIDGIVSALATTNVGEMVDVIKAGELVEGRTGRNIVTGHGKNTYMSKPDMEGQAMMMVGQIKAGTKSPG